MTHTTGQSSRKRLPAFHRTVRGLASLPFTMGTTWIYLSTFLAQMGVDDDTTVFHYLHSRIMF